MMAEVQVLFEYKDSRRQLTLLPTAVCEVIGEEMVKFGYVTPIVKLSTSESSHADEYLLQRCPSGGTPLSTCRTWMKFTTTTA